MKNQTYDILKYVAQIVLPALGTLYFSVGQIWGLPYGEQVVGTIVAVDAFLGVLLGLSSNAYSDSEENYDGVLNVEENEDALQYMLELTTDPEDLQARKSITFKVNPPA